jgi:error-prone DNA polymerase
MNGFWDEFRTGALARGVSEQTAEKVFTQVIAFSEFGFPKSHAAAFGLLAYQSAWLRHYHPVEYYVGLFNNQPMGFYSLDALGRDAGRNGLEIRLPDVNESDVWCTVERETRSALRIGLGFVREWSEDTATAVVAERETRGPYRSMSDFVRRAPPSLKRPAIEHLVWVGGCDGFGLTRRELLWQVGLWLPAKPDQDDSRRRRQLELPLTHPYEQLPFGGIDPAERLIAEYAVLGFAASGHPLSLVREALPPGLVRSDALPQIEPGTRVDVAGLVVARQRPQTAKGFIFVLLEDETGMINVIVRPDIYELYRPAVRGEPFLRVSGKLTRDGGRGGSMNVIAEEVVGLQGGFLTALRRVAPDSKDWG